MIGEHGDSCVVAWSHVMVGNKPLDQLQQEHPDRYPSFDRQAMQTAVHRRGFDVLSGKGSTEFGIAAAATEVIKAILHNENKVLPCSVLLDGQYGEKEVFASVPVVVGAAGVVEVLELHLTPEEKEGFHRSCDVIRSYIDKAISIRPL
ncbi:hypothetical protein AGDE_14751 [Angomonas deanei]|nr:hypothetical protein AGDE_14751 [Angomonas deanei]|eukprot:EPY20295.1 hypothetical protein AGDE_14751 [Angomonas deanei]